MAPKHFIHNLPFDERVTPDRASAPPPMPRPPLRDLDRTTHPFENYRTPSPSMLPGSISSLSAASTTTTAKHPLEPTQAPLPDSDDASLSAGTRALARSPSPSPSPAPQVGSDDGLSRHGSSSSTRTAFDLSSPLQGDLHDESTLSSRSGSPSSIHLGSNPSSPHQVERHEHSAENKSNSRPSSSSSTRLGLDPSSPHQVEKRRRSAHSEPVSRSGSPESVRLGLDPSSPCQVEGHDQRAETRPLSHAASPSPARLAIEIPSAQHVKPEDQPSKDIDKPLSHATDSASTRISLDPSPPHQTMIHDRSFDDIDKPSSRHSTSASTHIALDPAPPQSVESQGLFQEISLELRKRSLSIDTLDDPRSPRQSGDNAPIHHEPPPLGPQPGHPADQCSPQQLLQDISTSSNNLQVATSNEILSSDVIGKDPSPSWQVGAPQNATGSLSSAHSSFASTDESDFPDRNNSDSSSNSSDAESVQLERGQRAWGVICKILSISLSIVWLLVLGSLLGACFFFLYTALHPTVQRPPPSFPSDLNFPYCNARNLSVADSLHTAAKELELGCIGTDQQRAVSEYAAYFDLQLRMAELLPLLKAQAYIYEGETGEQADIDILNNNPEFIIDLWNLLLDGLATSPSRSDNRFVQSPSLKGLRPEDQCMDALIRGVRWFDCIEAAAAASSRRPNLSLSLYRNVRYDL